MRIPTPAAVIAVAVLALVGCGEDAPVETASPSIDNVADPSAGMCAPGVTDCVDADLDGGADEFDSESERAAAQALLGLTEDELAPDVRVARRGDEHMALTEDYVLGRKTVELEPGDEGGFRVVSVVVELPDGPETFAG